MCENMIWKKRTPPLKNQGSCCFKWVFCWNEKLFLNRQPQILTSWVICDEIR